MYTYVHTYTSLFGIILIIIIIIIRDMFSRCDAEACVDTCECAECVCVCVCVY